MVERKPEGALTKDEKRIVKALINKGWRNQDIQALINDGRSATINSARITEVKEDQDQTTASDEEVEFFQIKKRSFDSRTGLNLFDDERLIRARKAMIVAVQIFNSAALSFKTEVFSVLANIAWTYLLHEHYSRNGVKTIQNDGRTLLLSQMIERQDCPLSAGARNNLRALKIIRDNVEHQLLGKGDAKWFGLFQACCLNFDRALCELFGERLTLANELAFALQFARMNVEQLATVNRYEIPAHIEALDARLSECLNEDQLADLEYQFRVVYTLDAASKSKAHFEFVRPESKKGEEIRNILFTTNRQMSSTPIYRVGFANSSKSVPIRHSRLTTILRRGDCIRYDPLRTRSNRKTPTKCIASIIPRIGTIRIRTNGWIALSRKWLMSQNLQQ
jgi:Protein of unknown function (DUF3644)